MTHKRAKFWLRVIGVLLILLAILGTSLQITTATENYKEISDIRPNVFSFFRIVSGISYFTLLFLFLTGILLFTLRSIGSVCFIISSVLAILLCSVPIILFLWHNNLLIPFELSYALRQVSGFAAAGLVPFVVGFVPFWGLPLVLLCFRALEVANENEKDNNEKTFNKSVHTDAE